MLRARPTSDLVKVFPRWPKGSLDPPCPGLTASTCGTYACVFLGWGFCGGVEELFCMYVQPLNPKPYKP